MDSALSLGINFWDTADVYNDGESEEMIGRWFTQGEGRREKISPQLVEEASDRLLRLARAVHSNLCFGNRPRAALVTNKLGLLATLLVATASLRIFVGHLAQRLLRRSPQDE